MIALKIVKRKIAWKKMDFADLVKVSCRLFSFIIPPISSRTEQFQNDGLRSPSFKTNFFRIAGTSEAKTSVSGKA